MDGFYIDDPMEEVRCESSAEVLKHQMRIFEVRYFSGIPPVADLEVGDVEGPAMLTPERIIRISPSAASWSKIRQVLVLHELIHHALWQRDGNPDEDEGARFQAEVERLWEAGAYKNLL